MSDHEIRENGAGETQNRDQRSGFQPHGGSAEQPQGKRRDRTDPRSAHHDNQANRRGKHQPQTYGRQTGFAGGQVGHGADQGPKVGRPIGERVSQARRGLR